MAVLTNKPVTEMTPEEIKAEKRSATKNIVLVSTSFLLLFTAFRGLLRLQSSLHLIAGMGVLTQSILYASLVVSCLFVPRFSISLIGHKWTMCVSIIGYISWMAANGYPVWATMIPGSILTGLCGAPLWAAQGSYFAIVAKRYSRLSKRDEAAIFARFFGIFFFIFQLCNIIGSVISSTILLPDHKNTSDAESTLLYCGANDCPDNPTNHTMLRPPDSKAVWTMLGAYISIAVTAALLLGTFVDPLPRTLRKGHEPASAGTVQLLLATARHFRHLRQLLIIPVSIYTGYIQAFYSAEFTKSFVTCPVGIWKVGLVTIPFGVMSALASLLGGRLVSRVGRVPIFTFGMVVDLCIQATLLQWTPTHSTEYVLYIISSLLGLTDGIWQTQVNGLVGSLFSSESEAAFSCYRLWESAGNIIGFACSSYLCTSTKLYMYIAILLISMLGYYAVEVVTWRERRMRAATGEMEFEIGEDEIMPRTCIPGKEDAVVTELDIYSDEKKQWEELDIPDNKTKLLVGLDKPTKEERLLTEIHTADVQDQLMNKNEDPL